VRASIQGKVAGAYVRLTTEKAALRGAVTDLSQTCHSGQAPREVRRGSCEPQPQEIRGLELAVFPRIEEGHRLAHRDDPAGSAASPLT
jgi:hypothetical protein